MGDEIKFEDQNLNSQDIFAGLVQKAISGEHSKFEFIRCWGDYRVIKLYLSGTRKVIKVFADLVKTLKATYLKQISTGEQELETLFALKQFKECKSFYDAELAIVKDMMAEYRTYVFSGHLLETMLGGVRPDSELVDYRKIPWKLF